MHSATPLPDPLVVAIYPRWSEACEIVTELITRLPGKVYVAAIAESNEEAIQFREHWHHGDEVSLLLFHARPGDSVPLAADVVMEVSKKHEGRAVGVLIADGPEASGYREMHRRQWNRALASELNEQMADVQVFEYSRNWLTSPPRIR